MTNKLDEMKKIEKANAIETVRNAFTANGLTVEDGANYGKRGSLIIHCADVDVQVKIITPNAKAGARYAVVEAE